MTQASYPKAGRPRRVPEPTGLVQKVNVAAAGRAGWEWRRGALVSDVAHERRTPLTIIDGQLTGVEDGVYPLDFGLIASVREEIGRLRRLTDDLSGLSRAEEGAFELHPQSTAAAALPDDQTGRRRPQ